MISPPATDRISTQDARFLGQKESDFMKSTLLKSVYLTVFFALSSPIAHADTQLDDRFSISLGVFLADRDTETRLDGITEDGTDIDFEGYLGASIGLHVLDTTVSLAVQDFGQGDAGEITAPLPVIGFRGQYDFSERWSFRASSEFFFIKFDNVLGSLTDLQASLDFAINKTFSIGLGVNSVVFDVDASDSGFSGEMESRYTGGLLFLKVNI
jgi:hypothetical protein